jgi:hypothetical protein
MITGLFEGRKFWNIVLVLAGVAGFARLFFGLMERPMPALASLLNVFCRWRTRKQFDALGLTEAADRITCKGGRALLVPNSAMISVERTE